jgi:hypothetical protein
MGRINLVGSTHLQSVGLDLARHRAVLFLEEGVIGLRGFCCQLNLPHCRCGEDPETRSTPGADVDRRIGEDQGGARANQAADTGQKPGVYADLLRQFFDVRCVAAHH